LEHARKRYLGKYRARERKRELRSQSRQWAQAGPPTQWAREGSRPWEQQQCATAENWQRTPLSEHGVGEESLVIDYNGVSRQEFFRTDSFCVLERAS